MPGLSRTFYRKNGGIPLKKNLFFRALLWLAAVAMLLPCLAACSGDGNGSDPTTPTQTKAGSATAEPTGKLSDFFGANAKEYVVIYPTSAKSTVIEAAKALTAALNSAFGLSLRCRTDNAVKATNSPCEILVGETNRSESKTLAATMENEGDWGIRWSGTRLAVCGKGNAATSRAVNRLLSDYVLGQSGTLRLPDKLDLHWNFREMSRAAFTLAESYRIIYPNSNKSDERRLGGALRDELLALTGSTETIKVQSDRTEDSGAEILIGLTNRPESTEAAKGLSDYHDYRVTVTGNKVVLSGNSTEALRRAAAALTEALTLGKITDLGKDYVSENLFYGEGNAARLPELASFVPSWLPSVKPALWLGNLDEKINAVTMIDARNLSAVRNGDAKNYTAGSFEAIASAILCGADLIVLDVFETKDHVLVAVPDGNLSGYTDAAKRYASLGAPSSTLVTDWTWEQIRTLKMNGSAFGRVLTLSEAVSLCAGHCMVYVNVSGADDWTDTLLYQAFAHQNAAKSYFIPNPDHYSLSEPKTLTALRKWVSRDKTNSSVSDAYNYWKTCVEKKPNHWSRLLWTNNGTDDSATWQSLRDEWKTFLYTSDIVAYCDYIGKNQSASTETDDVSVNQPYTIEQNDLGYRVMILSDTHYYTTSNIKEDNLGISRAKKKEFLMGQIRKEIDGRGLDAILVLGDLATDNWTVGLEDAKSDAEMYTKNTYYAKTLYDDCFKPFENELGIYVLAGNHDSFLNEKWKEMFGTDRQFSFKIGNMAFIMLDTFSNQGSNSKGNGTSYVGIDKTWLASEMAKYRDCKVIVCSHYFGSMKELKELSDRYSNIIGFFHGHTHLYEVVDVGNGTKCINDGGFSYTAFTSESGDWNFEYLDPRSAWGYCIVEWSEDNSRCVSYRTSLAITYEATNMTYKIAKERKTADIALS